MSGIIEFTLDHWHRNNATVTTVDGLLIEVLQPGPGRDAVEMQLACNGLHLDLRDTSMSEVVDAIANDLTVQIEGTLEGQARTAMLEYTRDLVAMARLQQAINSARRGNRSSPDLDNEVDSAVEFFQMSWHQLEELHRNVCGRLATLLDYGWPLNSESEARLRQWFKDFDMVRFRLSHDPFPH